jgi:hypothetical protein
MIFACREMAIVSIYAHGVDFRRQRDYNSSIVMEAKMLFVILAGIGLSHLIVDGSIFHRPRGWVVSHGPEWLKQLVTCYQCTGFWTGAVSAFAYGCYVDEWNADWTGRLLLFPLLYGFIVSYLSMAGAALLNYLDQPYYKNEK